MSTPDTTPQDAGVPRAEDRLPLPRQDYYPAWAKGAEGERRWDACVGAATTLFGEPLTSPVVHQAARSMFFGPIPTE